MRTCKYLNCLSVAALSAALLLPFAEAYAQAARTIYADNRLSAACATYNVQARTCSGGSAQAYPSLAAAVAATTPGTTVLLRGGTFNEQLRPTVSGTQAAPITFKRYEQEEPLLVATPAVRVSSVEYIILDGIKVDGYAWLEATGMQRSIIRNSSFLRNPHGGTTHNVRLIRSHYNVIENNQIIDGNDNIVLADSNYNVIKNNIIREGRHSLITVRCSDYNIIRGNTFSNTQQKIAEVYDCGADTSAVPNSFNSTKHNIFEDNIFEDASSYYSTSAGNGIQYAGQEGIIRRNVFYNGNVGIAMAHYDDEALYTNDNRIYHNVFYNNEGAGLAPRNENLRNIYKNNILLKNKGCANSNCTTGVSAGQIVYRGSLGQGARYENNNILYESAGQPVIEREFGTGVSIAQYSASNPNVLFNTLELDPRFMNEAAYDFKLRSDSPMIDRGAFLTTTTSAGNGNTITVLDAHSFFDGFGIPGEVGDEIQLQGQTEAARITRVDYTAKTLTLDRPLNWNAGQGVALRYAGIAPDIGAFEYALTTPKRPGAPRALRVVE